MLIEELQCRVQNSELRDARSHEPHFHTRSGAAPRKRSIGRHLPRDIFRSKLSGLKLIGVAEVNSLDLFDVRSALSEEERMVQDSVARLVDDKVLPIIQSCFEEHRFPRELVPELA